VASAKVARMAERRREILRDGLIGQI
jgi:hypothetical protein